MRVIVRLLAILVLVAGITLAELPPPSPVAALTTAEMLYLVTKFIQWPPQGPAAQAAVNPSGSGAPGSGGPGSGGPGSGQFLLGIMGNDPDGSLLRQQLDGQPVRGRPIVLPQIQSIAELRECQVVFIAASERTRLRQIFKSLRGFCSLTIPPTPTSPTAP